MKPIFAPTKIIPRAIFTSSSFQPIKSLLAVLLAGAGVCGGAMAKEQPNIILFFIDDMGWQDTSVPFWHTKTPLNERYRTPHMEKLAEFGMKFTQAYACPVCSPSRVSLMTGLNAARHRVTDWTLNKVGPNEKPSKDGLTPPIWNANGLCPNPGLERSVHARALPSYLQQAGYRTIHVGKAHFGARKTAGEDPKAIGFDVNIAGHAPGGPASFLGTKSFAKNPKNPGSNVWDVPGLEAYHGKDIFLTEALTLEANKAVDAAVKDNKPFFLYMSHYAVHVPFADDKRFTEKYRGGDLPEKEVLYAGMVEGMDKSLGDLMENLKKHQIEENTIVLFFSDNGGLSAVGRGGGKNTHNLPLKSGKGSVYEGGIRVPMIVQWPGKVKANTVSTHQVIVEDFFPTLLEVAGVKDPQQIGGVIDGQSFVPVLKGESADQDTLRPLVWHYPNRWGPKGPGISWSSAMRLGDWKLIFRHRYSAKEPQFELYNLIEDIGEQKNVWDQHPQRAAMMVKALANELKRMDAQMPTDSKTGEPIPLPSLP